MFHRIILLPVTLIAAAAPAAAATLVNSGTFSGNAGDVWEEPLEMFDDVGVYSFNFVFSQPSASLLFWYRTEFRTFYCYHIGSDDEFCGGNIGGVEGPSFGLTATPGKRTGGGIYKIPRGYTFEGPDFFDWGVYGRYWAIFQYTLAEAGSVDWRVETSYLTAVPEPASWALMIAGFGLAGVAMRRSRTATRLAIG